MIDNDVLKYFTTAAWLRGYAEAIESSDSYVKPAIAAKLKEAANMLDYVFTSQINKGGDGDDL